MASQTHFHHFHLDLLSIASQIHPHLFIWTYSLLPVKLIVIFFCLDLLSIASQTHFHLFIWTYSLSPVNLIVIFSSGLTLYRQSNSFSSFSSGLTLYRQSISFSFFLSIWTYLRVPILFIWTYLRVPILFIYLDLPLIASLFSIFSYLDLPLSASFSNFHLPGLTSDCQFFSIFLTWTHL